MSRGENRGPGRKIPLFWSVLVRSALLVALASLAARVVAGEWTSWSGPNFDLSVRDAGLAARPAFGLTREWVRPLGSSYAGIVVAENRLVTLTSDGKSDLVVALDVGSGEELWRAEIAKMYQGHDGSHDGPNATPLIAKERVYGLGPWGHLFASSLKDGRAIFKHQLAESFGAAAPAHGFTTAPTLVAGVLVVQTGGAGGHSISAFDPRSGKLLWQTGNDAVEYQSPLALEVAGTPLVLAVTSESLLGLSPSSGEELFRFAHQEKVSFAASQPIPVGDGKVLLTGRRGSGLYQIAKKVEGGYLVSELWSSRSLRGSYTIPVPYEGHVYGYSGSFLTCVDLKTGETVWKSRPPGSGTLVLVDGYLFVFTQKGELVAAKASPAGYEEITRLKVLDEGSLTAPSFAAGSFFVRSLTQIARVGVRDAAQFRDAAPRPAVEVEGLLADFVAQVSAEADPRARQERIAEFLAAQKSFPIIEGDSLVHFVYQGQVADLALAGNFYADENEKPMGRIEGTDFYYRSVRVAPAAHYTYHFQVFGESRLDPRNPRQVEGRLAPSSELVLPGWPEPKHIGEPQGPRGRLETLDWVSAKLGNQREVRVYLPAGYDSSGERYPLLIVNEGDEALRFGRMAQSLDNLIGDSVAPVVVAFVPNRGLREYVSVQGLEDLTAAMVGELLPQIAARYRLSERAGAHAILGTTLGASHAMFAALEHPEIFGRVALQSYLAYQSESVVAGRLSQGLGKGLRVYVELNANDHQFALWAHAEDESRRLVERLLAGGAEVIQLEVADGPDWSSWRSRTDRILIGLYPLH